MSKKVKIQITHWVTGAVLFEYASVAINESYLIFEELPW
jgi:hypothetical protein